MSNESADRHDWEVPGAFEVASGVYRIPLPLPMDHLRAVNVYVIDDGDDLVVVDAGEALEVSEKALSAALRRLGRSIRDIRTFLVTHVHRDHYTQAIALRRTHGMRVGLGDAERATLEAVRQGARYPDEHLLVAAGAAELGRRVRAADNPCIANFADPDFWLDNAMELPLQTRRLRVIATPGHTRGHVVFHDEDAGVLFSGDHVLPHITPSIGVEVNLESRRFAPLADYLTSLQLVARMPDSIMLPAHGPAGAGTHARVAELLDHHETRLEHTLSVVTAGASTGFDTAQALKWTRRGRSFAELELFDQVLAINETVAHLEVLVDRQQLDRVVDGDGIVRYTTQPCRDVARPAAG